MDFLDTLIETSKIAESLKEHAGKSYGAQLGVVMDNEDPEEFGRVRATTKALGGVNKTDWLYRLVPFYGMSTPVPPVGSLVLVLYEEGDLHRGFYVGVLTNQLNPHRGDRVVLQVPPRGYLELTGNSFKVNLGEASLELKDTGRLEFSGITKLTFNGEEKFTEDYVNYGYPWLYDAFGQTIPHTP